MRLTFSWEKGYTLESTRGAQQGDVLGPALFALALQPVVERLCGISLELHIWYLDDGIFVGTIDRAAVAERAFTFAWA